MGHRTYRFSVESSAPPEALIAAATDFTDGRLYYWPTISAKRYRLHSSGDSVAEVTEGEGPIWTRSRYEWTPDRVRGTVVGGNAVTPGDFWEMRVAPSGDGGSRADITIDHRWHGLGLLGQLLATVLGADRFFARDMRETVRRIEARRAVPLASAAAM